MQVVKNMLTSNPNKGTDMKSFFVLLFPFVLVGCGAESPPSPDRGSLVATIEDPEPVSDAPKVSPTIQAIQADAVAAIKKLGAMFSSMQSLVRLLWASTTRRSRMQDWNT